MVDILQKDKNGEYEMIFEVDKLHSVCDKTIRLFFGCGNATYNFIHEGLDDEQAYIRDMFARDCAAMATVRILELEAGSIRNMENEFGVVPMPKYDEIQKGYRTLLHDQFTVMCVPTTVEADRLDEISAVLEAMASTGYRTVRPAYYETTLRTKIAQDPQSAMMMDIITQGIYIDAGIVYTSAFNSFHAGLRTMVGEKQNNAISRYKAITKGAEAKLRGMVKKLDKLAERNQ